MVGSDRHPSLEKRQPGAQGNGWCHQESKGFMLAFQSGEMFDQLNSELISDNL